jgi:hypothetical protein
MGVIGIADTYESKVARSEHGKVVQLQFNTTLFKPDTDAPIYVGACVMLRGVALIEEQPSIRHKYEYVLIQGIPRGRTAYLDFGLERASAQQVYLVDRSV